MNFLRKKTDNAKRLKIFKKAAAMLLALISALLAGFGGIGIKGGAGGQARPSFGTPERGKSALTAVAEIKSDFAGGDGSGSDPFVITTARHLDNMRWYLYEEWEEDPEPYHFALGGDIDLKAALAEGGELYGDGNGWLPIGNKADEGGGGFLLMFDDIDEYFFGTLDGRGHTVSGLWIDRGGADSVGLFGYIKDTQIKDLNIVLGEKGINGGVSVGDLAGVSESSVVEGCSVTGAVSAGGDINAEPVVSCAGGLIGTAYDTRVSESYFKGTVCAEGYAGGLVGWAKGLVAAENCYVSAKISSKSACPGGIFGYANPTDLNYSYPQIKRCFSDVRNRGADIADPFTGMFTHYNNDLGSSPYRAADSYYAQYQNIETNEAFTVLTSAVEPNRIKERSSFPSFDFDTVWGIYEECGTPYLRRFHNAVLIIPISKAYNKKASVPKLEFLGDYDPLKPIDARITADCSDCIKVGLYDLGVEYSTEHPYQVSIGLYEITPPFRMPPRDIGLIVLGAAAVFAAAAFAIVWFGFRKKSFADLGRGIKGIFIKEKTVEVVKTETVVETVEVVKEVPLLKGLSLPKDLSPKEREVAELILQGKNRREIAKEMRISEETVKTYISRIFVKLGVDSQKQFITMYL